MSEPLKILLVDEERTHPGPVAEAFNDAGLLLRFVTDRRKALGGLRALRPDMLMLHGEVRSELVSEVLAAVASDPTFGNMPIVLLCKDTSDAPFLSGLRTGVVELLELPFSATLHVPRVRALFSELPTRSGTVVGQGESEQLTNLIEHLRRARRSGVVTLNGRTPSEGWAAFVAGKHESAQMGELSGVSALVAMVSQPRATWTFSEVGGAAGDGSGMVIEFGAAKKEEEDEEEEVSIVEPISNLTGPVEPAPSRPDPIRLLLVDDDDSLCQMFSRLFNKRGFAVSVAQDGMEGYEAALATAFDVVIADLNMPRMDGWGMLRLMRADYRTRELPIAFLSCQDDYRDSLRALDAGAQAYFSKQTRLDALVNHVRELLAPRERLLSQLEAGTALAVSTGVVGAQWLMRQLARVHFSGKVEVKDAWASYQLFLTDGRPVHASALAGRHGADGERAFNALVASKGAEGSIASGTFPSPTSLFEPMAELLAKAAATMNDNERRLREGLLVNSGQISVNRELYALYAQVGPKGQLEAARLICEEKLSPREAMQRANISPLEVEETVKDLLRRGVVTLGS